MRNFQKKNEKSKRQPINIDSDFNDLLTAAPMTEKEKYLHESYLNSKYYEKVCKISNKAEKTEARIDSIYEKTIGLIFNFLSRVLEIIGQFQPGRIVERFCWWQISRIQKRSDKYFSKIRNDNENSST